MNNHQELIAGRYKANRLIGKGGMGKVFLGEHAELGQEVAIKCLRSHSKDNENSVRRFCLEASTYASINHPNLVKLHEFERTQRGELRMILEYVRGDTLGTVLHQYKALHPLFAIDVTVQIAQGLSAAHDKNIIHRDLKPDNIILSPLTKDRRRYHVKLLDFGIAKQLYREKDNNLTAMGMVCGTPDYMSPEQACGHQVGKQSDIYSLGVVFFEMLAGRLPYIGDNKRHVMQAHCSNPIPNIAQYSPYMIPQSLEDIMQRCLAKNAKDRYQSLDELIQALDELVLCEYNQRALGNLLGLPIEQDQEDHQVQQIARSVRPDLAAKKGLDEVHIPKPPHIEDGFAQNEIKHFTSGVQLMSAKHWIEKMILEVQNAFKYNQNNRHIMLVGAAFLFCLAITLTLKIKPDINQRTIPPITSIPSSPSSFTNDVQGSSKALLIKETRSSQILPFASNAFKNSSTSSVNHQSKTSTINPQDAQPSADSSPSPIRKKNNRTLVKGMVPSTRHDLEQQLKRSKKEAERILEIKKDYKEGYLSEGLKKLEKYGLAQSHASLKEKLVQLRQFYRKASSTPCPKTLNMIKNAPQEYQHHTLTRRLKERCNFLPPAIMK